MKPMREQKLLTCPCCGQIRTPKEHRYFTNTVLDKYYMNEQGEFYLNEQGEKVACVYWVHPKRGSSTWACDACMQDGRALKAHPMKQNFCDCQPHFAYFDRAVSCRDCAKEFVFSKEEQYHWFEKLGLLVQARQVRCHGCRAIKKQKDRLNFLLSNADYNDPVKVEETVKLCVKRQEYERAKTFLAVGKRKYARKSAAFQFLEELWLRVEKAAEVATGTEPG